MNPETLINTAKYTPLELVLFSVGGLFCVVCYVAVLRKIRQHGVVEIPAAAVASNFAWEITWGLLYRTDLGLLFVWGYRTWLVLDVFIFGYLFLIGAKHVKNQALLPYFRPALLAGCACWVAIFYFFVQQGYDTTTGLTTGYVATMIMSALYLVMELADITPGQYSALAAWMRLLSNGLVSVFCFLVYPELRFLLTLCVLTFVLDCLNLVQFRRRLTPLSAPAPAST